MTNSDRRGFFVCFQPRESARARFVCFPYAGAGASVFRPWLQGLPSDVELWAVQLPGREERRRESPYRSMRALVAALADEPSPAFKSPFVFYGHSLGALMAFELARELRRRDRPGPRHLFVSGRRAPQRPIVDFLHKLPQDRLLARMQRLGGFPEVILQEPELVEMFLSLIRNDLTLNEAEPYCPEEPLDCPISVYGGLEDEMADTEALGAWAKQTRQAFNLQRFSGGHFFIQTARDAFFSAIRHKLAGISV